jgi:anaerobic magnesium-protoporphyrin IX monomethyl ester cyclase
MIDSIIIGYNNYEMNAYVSKVKSMGLTSGAYRDLNVNHIKYADNAYYALDILSHFYHEGREASQKPFHVFDLLNPAIIYLGTYLHKRGFNFNYVNLFHFEKEKLQALLTENEVLTVAITTTNYVSPEPIQEIISFVKKYNQQAKIIVGGPYINYQYKTQDRSVVIGQFEYLDADFYVMNVQGEESLVNILKSLKNGHDFDQINNIAYKFNGHYVFTLPAAENTKIAENMVDFSLFPQEDIGTFVNLRTAISCPFACDFCAYPVSAGKYNYLSPHYIERELDYLHSLGTVSTIFFMDDTFNVPKERFHNILRMMIKNQYKFKWSSFLRCDHADEETIELMAQSGCEGVFLGIESGSEFMLRRMKSNASLDQYFNGMSLLHKFGIATHANVIVGFPGETYDTVQETVAFIEEAKPTFFKAQLWYADPITPVWAHKQAYGIKGSAYNWSHDTMDYQTACDLIDHMILSVENSIWSTQYGFVWGVFYLQRRGMKIDQVIAFAKAYNQLIKEKLLFPNKPGIYPQLIENLRRICQFDRPEQPDPERLEPYTGVAYKAAETFWQTVFEPDLPPSNIEAEHGAETTPDGPRDTLSIALDPTLSTKLESLYDCDLSRLMLAAYSIMLARINGRQDVLIAASIEELDGQVMVVPIRLSPRLDLTVKAFLAELEQLIEQLKPHHEYGFHFLNHPLRLQRQGASKPACDVGYRYRRGLRQGDAEQAPWGVYPQLQQNMMLVLEIATEPAGQLARFSYPSVCFSRRLMSQFSDYLMSILQQMVTEPDALLEPSSSTDSRTTESGSQPTDATEQFRF